MIIVRLAGGLGNQMFQYAAGRTLADRFGTDLLLDTRFFSNYKLHAYGLERFSVRARQATPKELTRWPNWLRRPSRLAQRMGIRSRWYSELKFGCSSGWLSIPNDVLIDGYFQSEKYFAPIATALRTDFTPYVPLTSANKAIVEAAQISESVMIHVRRGDYVSDMKTLKIHGVCTPAYYQAAIQAMRERLHRPRFIVFSNDMEWARKNLDLGTDAIFVEGNEKCPEVDIFLMSKCSNHIIANSSFSWWGAWLGKNNKNSVIAPSPWFDDQKLIESDLIPNNWSRLAK